MYLLFSIIINFYIGPINFELKLILNNLFDIFSTGLSNYYPKTLSNFKQIFCSIPNRSPFILLFITFNLSLFFVLIIFFDIFKS